MNSSIFNPKSFLLSLFIICFQFNIFSQFPILLEPSIIEKFYTVNPQRFYWFSSDKNIVRAIEWLTMINTADNSEKVLIDDYHAALFNKNISDSTKENTDKLITGAVLNYLKEWQQGSIKFDYDEVSVSHDSIYIAQLLNSESTESVEKFISHLECKDHDYLVLKNYLKDSITINDTLKYKMVLLAMNYRKYFTANKKTEYIIVNIPAAEAAYYKNDSLFLKMRTIVGRKTKHTPVVASYITSIVTFPYWKVPRSISIKEILPKVQKNADYLEKNNFEVVDLNEIVIDDATLIWNDYSEKNFPFYLRQSTGFGNALGVLKFELKNPFSIFLHATSNQLNFTKEYRFLSHGCIQLEKPFALADALFHGKINFEALKKEKNKTESNILILPKKIPVFIIYMPVTIIGNEVLFLQDVYAQIK